MGAAAARWRLPPPSLPQNPTLERELLSPCSRLLQAGAGLCVPRLPNVQGGAAAGHACQRHAAAQMVLLLVPDGGAHRGAAAARHLPLLGEPQRVCASGTSSESGCSRICVLQSPCGCMCRWLAAVGPCSNCWARCCIAFGCVCRSHSTTRPSWPWRCTSGQTVSGVFPCCPAALLRSCCSCATHMLLGCSGQRPAAPPPPSHLPRSPHPSTTCPAWRRPGRSAVCLPALVPAAGGFLRAAG